MTKFIFANQLRGIAALLVVMSHYFGVFFANQDLLATLTFSPNVHAKPAPWVHMFELPYQGPSGVALFFLISGFVIPFSLKKTSLPGFLVNRVLRIFPTYACCLGLGTLMIYLSAHYWGQTFEYPFRVVLANALLVFNQLDMPSMDCVNWTLSIEIKFYLLAALGAGAFFRRSPAWLLGFLAAAMLATWGWTQIPSRPFILFFMELNYIIFMLIGSLFYQHAAGMISTRSLLARIAVTLAAFSYTWSIGPQQSQFPAVTWFYYSAVLVFGACYALRHRFKPQRTLDFLASISYPLYCVHALFGYSALKMLMDIGLPFGIAVALTLPAALTLAYAVHLSIESSTNALGRKWGERLSRNKVMAAPLAV